MRPFINAAGTFTDMTASLMPPEVMAAINYASKHFVPLNELHDRVGERIATLVKAEAAMVPSGAASAMTLGTAGVLTGTDGQKIVDLPNLAGMKSEVIMQKSHRFGYDHAVRNSGVKIVEVETAEELERAITPQTAMMLFYNNNNSLGQVRHEQFVAPRQEARRADDQRLRGRRAAGREPVEVHGDGLRPGRLLRRQGHPRSAERRAAPRPQGSDRRRPRQRGAQRQFDRPRHEGEQGRDARDAGRARAVPEPRSRGARPRVPEAGRRDPEEPRRPAGPHRRGHRAGSGQPRAARARSRSTRPRPASPARTCRASCARARRRSACAPARSCWSAYG